MSILENITDILIIDTVDFCVRERGRYDVDA